MPPIRRMKALLKNALLLIRIQDSLNVTHQHTHDVYIFQTKLLIILVQWWSVIIYLFYVKVEKFRYRLPTTINDTIKHPR